MAETAFTPGPWSLYTREGRPYQVLGGALPIVAWGGICRRASEDGKANARLIAAAPDLLAALQGLISPDGKWVSGEPQVRAAAIAAIAKATTNG